MIALMNGMTPRRRSHTSVRRSFIGEPLIEIVGDGRICRESQREKVRERERVREREKERKGERKRE